MTEAQVSDEYVPPRTMAAWRAGNPQRPSPTLAEYLADDDPNAFWRLESGDHENLLDEAIECMAWDGAEILRLREALETVRVHACGEPSAVLLGIESIARHALREADHFGSSEAP